jgi:hypothetical protein
MKMHKYFSFNILWRLIFLISDLVRILLFFSFNLGKVIKVMSQPKTKTISAVDQRGDDP